MTCIVKKHHLKALFKEMQFVAFFIFHMEKTRMQVKNYLRCLRQKNLKNLLLWNRWTDFNETWYVALGTLAHHSLYKS